MSIFLLILAIVVAYILVGSLVTFVYMIIRNRKRISDYEDYNVSVVLTWLFWPVVVTLILPIWFCVVLYGAMEEKAFEMGTEYRNNR